MARLPAVDTEFYCENILRLSANNTFNVAKALSVHTVAENQFALALAAPAFAIPSIPGVLLGGVWSLGELAWFDGTPASPSVATNVTAPYTNWSTNAPPGSGGCIAMAADGSWFVCSCTSDKLPFICGFDLTATPPPATLAPSTGPPSTGAPTPAPSAGAYAPRPVVPRPMPPCPAGWTGSDKTGKCYVVVSNGTARQPEAQAQCTSMHPSATLTSVLSPDEDALITTLLQDAASSAAKTAAGSYLALVGGTFMDNGNIGVWFEDNVWYPTWAGASSPSWPTPTSGYFTNWMAGEPSMSFGCLGLNSSSGMWAATSCQNTLSFVCAFLNDGATWPPTTAQPATAVPPTAVPTPVTPRPAPSQVPVNCPAGWFNATTSRTCVRVVSGFITAADLEATCNKMPPSTTATGGSYLVHAAAPATDDTNDAIAMALSQNGIGLALIGVSYIENGTHGMYLDGATEYSATFVLNHFAIGQPTSPGGCVMTRPDGRWVFIPCGLEGPAYVCSFSWDAYVASSNAPASTPAPNATPPSTSAPPVDIAQRIAALNGVTSLSVAKGTIGTYAVTSGGGSVEGLVLLFSPTQSCAGGTRGDLLASVFQGTIRLLHTLAVSNGTVCVSNNGSSFVATAIRFEVVPVVVAGFLTLSQNLYAPPLKRTNFSAADVTRSLVFGRRSNAVLQLVGSGPVDTALRFVRFASSMSCQDNLYSISELAIPVLDGVASVMSTFVVPQAAASRDPSYLDSNGATPPPRAYAICVSLDNVTFTRLVNASARLAEEFLSVQALGRITRANTVDASTTRLVVPQYAASRVALKGDGLSVGMQALLSFNRSLCPRQQQAPSFSLFATSDVPTYLMTVMPIMTTVVEDESSSGTVQRAYVQLNLNHTGMWGTDELVPFQDWYLCVARSAAEPFVATGLSIRIRRQSIAALAVSGDVPLGPQLNINTGFSGLVRIWGVDTTDWSTETISNLQVSLAEMPSGSAALPALAQQCSNASTFYGARAMSVVEGTSTNSSFDDVHYSGTLTSSLAVVFPPSFFLHQTTRRMRLCLSIPRSYDRVGVRTFAPTTATIDVRPIQLMFIGRFGMSSVASNIVTSIAVAENSDNVVFPLYGYGLQADMSLFLSQEPCMSQATFQDAGYIGRISKMNITIAAPYDVPVSFRVNNSQATAAASPVYMVLTKTLHTNPQVANAVFGTARRPLNVCIWAPQTRNQVYPTPFSLVVTRPSVQSVVDATGRSPAIVAYGSFADLLVTGVGLQGNATVMIPAIDCANQSTFLWKYPVALSPVPSLLTFSNANATQRFSDYATQNSSWFIPLNQQQTARVGTQVVATDAGRLITRFQWCVNYDRTDAATYTFEPTGIVYKLSIPAVAGFVNNNPADSSAAVVTTLYVPREDPLLGQWSKATIVGPLVEAAKATGNPLYMFFTEPLIPCARFRTTILSSNASDRFVVAINGTMLLLPSHVNVAGTYKVCISMLYPASFDSAAIAVESTLQFIELPTLRISVVATQFKLFTLNSSLSVSFQQGESPMISVDGVGLSIRARLRLMSSTALAAGLACGSTPMPGGIGDLVVRQVFPKQRLGANQNAQFFVALEHQESRLIPAGTYYVCFSPNPAEPWMLSGSIRVTVVTHQRRPTLYNYFVDDDRFDVAELRAVAPSKLVLPQSSGEAGVVNVVGTIGREVSLQLLCYNGTTNTNVSPVVSCGDNKRVMFVRPMEDDSDPCFIDDEDEDWENVRGPFLMRSSVVTVPRLTSTGYSYVPGFDDAWVMCVETSPDYWRRPTAPAVLLQFTSQMVTAVRVDGPDTPNNSTARFPSVIANTLPGSGTQQITLYAGDVSQVVYLNGFGIQYGLLVRFGASCATDGNESTVTNGLPINQLLYTTPLMVGDDSGSIVIPANYFSLPEDRLLSMCISDASGNAFRPTPISLAVFQSRIVRDASFAQYTDGHVLSDAFRDTLVLPLMSRGLVDLSVLRAATNEAVAFGTGALVMFSSTCLYSSHGLPYLQVQTDSLVSVSYQHTGTPTPTLKVCVRRLWEFQDNSGSWRTVFATPLFIDTGLTFRVLNVSLASVSAHTRKIGVEAQHDINHLLFHPRGRDLLVPLTFAFNPMVDRSVSSSSSSSGSTIMDSLDDANTLAFFGLAQFRVGRPCYQGVPSAVAAAVGSLSMHTATFDHGRVTVVPDGTQGFHVPLRVDAEFAADPWNPYSMCLSVDGGRTFISVGVAYFTADWQPTVYVMDGARGFAQDITIYEATSVFTEFSDARYDTRILANTAPDFVDNELSRELNRFTVDALWTGFIGDVGYAQEGVLYIPSEIVSDGEAVEATSTAAAALASTDATLLTFTYDIAASNISTGVTLRIAPMQLRCLDGGLQNILVNPEETGRVFDIAATDGTMDACGLGINDGSVFRLATNCSAPYSFVGDIVVDASLRLILPPVLPFLSSGVYQLCLKKFLPLRLSASLGVDAEFLPTSVSMELTPRTVIDQIDGLSKGLLIGFYGDDFSVPVAGAGVSSTSVILSLVDVGTTMEDASGHTDTTCQPILGYVDSQGQPYQNNTLLDWFPVTAGAMWTIPAAANVPSVSVMGTAPTETRTYLVCASFDFGLSFQKAGSGIYYSLVPPTVVGLAPYALPSGSQLYDPAKASSNGAQYLRMVPPTATSSADKLGNATAAGAPNASPLRVMRQNELFDYFFSSEVPQQGLTFLGNGIGKRSRRALPLTVALVDTSMVGFACNGSVPPSAILRTVSVDGRTGKLLPTTVVPLVPSGIALERPGTTYMLCTSADQRNFFYSPNVPSFLSSDAGWLATSQKPLQLSSLDISATASTRLSQYVAQPTVLVAQRSTAATQYVGDMTLSFGVLLRFLHNTTNGTGDTAKSTSVTFAIAQLQRRIAKVLGDDYATSSVAISVNTQTGRHFMLSDATDAPFYAVTVRLLTEGRNASSGEVLSKPLMYARLWSSILAQNTTQVMQGLVDRNIAVVAPVVVNVTFDDGTAIQSSPLCSRQGGASSLYATYSDLRFTDLDGAIATLCAISPLLINNEPIIALTDDDLQPKSSWSAIPIVMVMPFLLLFGTYHLYAKYFDIITPEELAARERREGEDMALRREKRTLALKGTAANRSVLDTMPDVGVEIQDSFVMQGQELKATVGKGLETVGAAVASAASNVQAALTTGANSAPPAGVAAADVKQ